MWHRWMRCVPIAQVKLVKLSIAHCKTIEKKEGKNAALISAQQKNADKILTTTHTHNNTTNSRALL